MQVAQNGPPDPGYVTPQQAPPTGAPTFGPGKQETALAAAISDAQAHGNKYLPALLLPKLQELQAARLQKQNEANEIFKSKLLQAGELTKLREQQLADQAKRIQEYQKSGQGLVGGAPGAPTGAQAVQPGADPRLGTQQSPQRTGVPVPPPLPPGVTPEKWAELQAPKLASAVDAYEKAVPQFDEAVKMLRLAREHPGREWGLGSTSEVARRMPGTSAYAFGAIMDQIAGKNFLSAYSQLKGGGSITEIEGSKAEKAQARLATAQNKNDFDTALDDFEKALRQDLETVQRKVNRPVTAWRTQADNSSVAPDIGQRRGNTEYIGGNPADPMSWRRVQ